MKSLEQFLRERAAILIIAVLLAIASLWIDSLELQENTTVSKEVLRVGMTILMIVLLFLSSWTISHIKNKKNLKKYTDNQIKITKEIINNKIQNINDFLFNYFQACPQHKPFNSSDKNTNLLILDNEKDVDALLKEFKDIMNDIIKYEYLEIEIDITIEIFTYLKYYDNSKKEAVRFLDMEMIFNNKFKQYRFIVKNHEKLKKLIKLKALPEQVQLNKL